MKRSLAVFFYILLLGGLLNSQPLAAAATTPLFSSEKVLELALTVDFDSLCRPREVENCDYTPTNMVYRPADGEEYLIPIEIQVRGGWRSRRDHCAVPPLFVRFPGNDIEDTPFADQHLLPLTTHCRSKKDRKLNTAGGRDYEQYVLREYLGYRLFNLLGAKSLRVRLARIHYYHPQDAKQSVTRYAFFTEHFDSMAARYDAEKLADKRFDHEKIDLQALDTVALFQFMIGNTDWSAMRDRNIVLISAPDGGQVPVPYDLDMAGLVDADYAGVSPRLPFRDPRQRYYLGYCHPDIDFDSLFARFRAQQPEILALVKDIPGLNRASKIDARSYLKRFFSILRSAKRSDKRIVSACQPWPPSPEDHTTPPDAAKSAP